MGGYSSLSVLLIFFMGALLCAVSIGVGERLKKKKKVFHLRIMWSPIAKPNSPVPLLKNAVWNLILEKMESHGGSLDVR